MLFHWMRACFGRNNVLFCLAAMDSKNQEKLKQQLAALPPKAAIALLRDVQCDELRGGNTYPHDYITRQLIENLARQGFKAELLGQPWVLFCEPFDVFLVDEKKDPKQRGIILRKSVTTIWNWMLNDLFKDRLPDLEIEIIQALGDNRDDQARELMSEFHRQVGDRIWTELSEIEEGSRVHLNYNAKFGSPGVFEDSLEMARILRIAPALLHLRNQIRTGLTLQHDEDIAHCHDLYMQFLQSADDHVELGMVLLSRRLKKPYEVMKILRHHTGSELDTVILQDPASLSATLILRELEGRINEAINLISGYKDFPRVADILAQFYECLELFTSLIEISPRSLWGSLIIQIRNDLSSAIKEQIEQLPRLINTLRYKKNTRGLSSSGYDDANGPNTYDITQTIYIAELLRLSGRQLNQLSINDAFAKAKNEANNFIEAVAEIIVSELAKGDAREKQAVLKYFKPILELTLILQGEELAGLLERRGDSAFRARPAEKTDPS